MKKLLFIIAVILIASCEKEPSSKGKLNPNALISIRPAAGVKSNLSAKDIVKNTHDLSFYPKLATLPGARGFSATQRDTVNVKLLMWGTDIIDQFGKYTGEFIEGRDFVFRKAVNLTSNPPIFDTIAYIPNSVITEARGKIVTAFADSNFVEVYRLFDVAFTFTPIGGAEWRALKAAGQN